MLKKNYIYIFITAVLIAAFSLTSSIMLEKIENSQEKRYVLKEYENEIVLYEDEKIIKKYNDVSVFSLPIRDRSDLEKGISVKNEAEAELFIENYDGWNKTYSWK